MIDLLGFGYGAGIVLFGWFAGVLVSIVFELIRKLQIV